MKTGMVTGPVQRHSGMEPELCSGVTNWEGRDTGRSCLALTPIYADISPAASQRSKVVEVARCGVLRGARMECPLFRGNATDIPRSVPVVCQCWHGCGALIGERVLLVGCDGECCVALPAAHSSCLRSSKGVVAQISGNSVCCWEGKPGLVQKAREEGQSGPGRWMWRGISCVCVLPSCMAGSWAGSWEPSEETRMPMECARAAQNPTAGKPLALWRGQADCCPDKDSHRRSARMQAADSSFKLTAGVGQPTKPAQSSPSSASSSGTCRDRRPHEHGQGAWVEPPCPHGAGHLDRPPTH